VTIRISTATTDDLPEIVASVDALFATDAGAHNAAATNLRWASENGIAYYTSLLADSNNLVLLARDDNEVAGHLIGRMTLARSAPAGDMSGLKGKVGPLT
jgi:hypothetical protein